MNQETIVIVDNTVDLKREIVFETLKKHLKAAPDIRVKLGQLADPIYGGLLKITATQAARQCEVISVYEYRNEYYVITGHILVENFLANAERRLADGHEKLTDDQIKQLTLKAKLIVKHTLKRAEPSQITPGALAAATRPITYHEQNYNDAGSATRVLRNNGNMAEVLSGLQASTGDKRSRQSY